MWYELLSFALIGTLVGIWFWPRIKMSYTIYKIVQKKYDAQKVSAPQASSTVSREVRRIPGKPKVPIETQLRTIEDAMKTVNEIELRYRGRGRDLGIESGMNERLFGDTD